MLGIGLLGLVNESFYLISSFEKGLNNLEFLSGNFYVYIIPVFILFIISALGTMFYKKWAWKLNIILLAFGIIGSIFMSIYFTINMTAYEHVFNNSKEKSQIELSREQLKKNPVLKKISLDHTKAEKYQLANKQELANQHKVSLFSLLRPELSFVNISALVLLNIVSIIVLTIIQLILIIFNLRYFLSEKIRMRFNIDFKNHSSVQKRLAVCYEAFALVFIFSGAVFLGTELGLTVNDLRNSFDISHLDDYSGYELPTEVYDIHGNKITEFFRDKRQIVNYEDLPENLINALIAMEDNRFYEHNGIDVYGIGRAMITNILAGSIKQGGSTITQQLAKLMFTNSKRTLSRKFFEIWLALQIEKRFSKNEILEKYFNQIYFGHGVYGVESACQYFFDKSVRDISVAEAAILVSIPPKPLLYSPFRNKKEAKEKQKIVLNKMMKLSFITQQEVDESNNQQLWKNIEERVIFQNPRSAWRDREDKAPYFSDFIRNVVLEDLKNDFGERDMENYLRTGGLKIYTTLDLKKQEMARKYLSEQLLKQDKVYYNQNKGIYQRLRANHSETFNFLGLSFLDGNYHFNYKQKRQKRVKDLENEFEHLELVGNAFGLDRIDRLVEKNGEKNAEDNLAVKTQGALICMAPATGHVVAMVGGRKFTSKNQLNRVFSKRQPGSSFKALVYGAAFQNGLSPTTMIEDKKITFGGWTIHSPTNRYYGVVSLRDAIRNSVNSVAVQVVRLISPQAVAKFAAPLLGIKEERLEADLTIGLGTSEVSPWEMCRAFSVYANRGKEVTPMPILRIVDRSGNVIKDYENELRLKRQMDQENGKSEQLITPQLAYLMSHCMMEVINNGTGKIVKALGFNRAAAGKTGTTQKSKDVWFVGYTPNLCTAVWVGFDRGMSLGNRQYGGTVAAPVWANFMKDAHQDLANTAFKKPVPCRMHWPSKLIAKGIIVNNKRRGKDQPEKDTAEVLPDVIKIAMNNKNKIKQNSPDAQKAIEQNELQRQLLKEMKRSRQDIEDKTNVITKEDLLQDRIEFKPPETVENMEPIIDELPKTKPINFESKEEIKIIPRTKSVNFESKKEIKSKDSTKQYEKKKPKQNDSEK